MQELFVSLDENIKRLKEVFKNCDDIVFREFYSNGYRCYMIYTDNIVDGSVIEESILTNLMVRGHAENSITKLMMNTIGVGEVSEAKDFETVIDAVLLGDTIVFGENEKVAIQISTKGWPSRGVPSAETEVTLLGPKDSFGEQASINTVLVRRRIRDPKLKVRRIKIGRRSKTDVAVLYMEDVVRPEILNETMRRLDKVDVDAVMSGGYLQQFIEESFMSPFPQMQLTERPDKTAAGIYEGRIAVIVDNAPFVILIPAPLNVFFQSADDYYERWQISSLLRFMRFGAAFLAACVPALYIALVVFHPHLIPSPLALKIAGSKAGVPFPTIVEVLIMELAFELLREAGIRLPSPAGGTIGIVGGIVIGQAAVDAGIVGATVVIISALTGICSFAIPNVSLVNSVRVVKYLLIFLSACLGLYGFWIGVTLVLVHLCSLDSFGIPYLFPFCGGSVNDYTDLKDSIIRMPLRFMRRRPIFANKDQIIRMREEKDGK
ncbi:MAG: spore germination protein [Firmicutes bacterium]|nr:spore germination protein [Bacillota bacterium]